jgi:hypothetical protein
MFKRLFFIFLLLGIGLPNLFSQTQKSLSSANLTDGDRFILLFSKSDTVTIPENIIAELKVFAASNFFEESVVLKNAVAFKVLYNKQFSLQERIFAVDYLIRLYSPAYSMLPLNLFQKLKLDFVNQLNAKR